MILSGGELVVRALRAHDVDTIFTVPGESFLPVLDALYDCRDEISLVSTRHEEGAGFAAEAYAKASGRMGVCMVTRGVGSTHASIAIHTAMQDATPLLVLVGQVSLDHRWREAFQELDVPHAFAGIAKGALEFPKVERVGELVANAVRVATTGRPGPVVVGMPVDVLYAEAQARPVPVTRVRRPASHEDDTDFVAARLRAAERPALLVGREILDEDCTTEVVRVAEGLGLPVYTTFRRFDAFPNDHDNYAGNVALGTPANVIRGLYEADVVVIVGDRLDEFSGHSYALDFAQAELIHVAGDASLLGTWATPATGIVSSATHFFTALSDAATRMGEASPSAGRMEWTRWCREPYLEASTYEPPFEEEAGAVNLSAAMRSIREASPKGTALVTDAGNFSAWVSRYYPFLEPHTHFGPISGAMGYAVPASIGIALARPGRPVVALVGDGGFPMTMSELSVAADRHLPIVFVVFVNGMYATMRMHQERQYPGRPIASDLLNPSFVEIAEAHGIMARRVASNVAFDEAIGTAFAAHGPVLIEVFEGQEKMSAWRPRAAPDSA